MPGSDGAPTGDDSAAPSIDPCPEFLLIEIRPCLAPSVWAAGRHRAKPRRRTQVPMGASKVTASPATDLIPRKR
jgi:hypothetical protein